MARLEDLALSHRLFMKGYRYRSVDWSPGARLVKPLSEARLALVSTAGLHLPDQPAFDPAIKGGDASFRELATDVEIEQLRIAHRSSTFRSDGSSQRPEPGLSAGSISRVGGAWRDRLPEPSALQLHGIDHGSREADLGDCSSGCSQAAGGSGGRSIPGARLTDVQPVRGTDREPHRKKWHPYRMSFAPARSVREGPTSPDSLRNFPHRLSLGRARPTGTAAFDYSGGLGFA